MDRLAIGKNFMDPNPLYQERLFMHAMNFKIFNFLTMFQTDSKSSDFFEKIRQTYLYYMNYNHHAHCLTSQFTYIGVIQKFFNSFPLQTSQMLLDVFKNYPRVFVVCEDPIYTIEDCFTKYQEKDTIESFKVKENLLKLMNIYNDRSFNKHMLVLIENDMEISLFIRDNFAADLGNLDEMKRLLQMDLSTPGEELSQAKAGYLLGESFS